MSRYADLMNAHRRVVLSQALTEAGGNKARAARALGLARSYFLRLLHDHGLYAPPSQPLSRMAEAWTRRKTG